MFHMVSLGHNELNKYEYVFYSKLTYRGWDKMDTILQPTCWNQFSSMKNVVFDSNFTDISSDNDLAPIRAPAIIWTNDGLDIVVYLMHMCVTQHEELI